MAGGGLAAGRLMFARARRGTFAGDRGAAGGGAFARGGRLHRRGGQGRWFVAMGAAGADLGPDPFVLHHAVALLDDVDNGVADKSAAVLAGQGAGVIHGLQQFAMHRDGY